MSNGMVQVRIRHAEDVEGPVLCSVPFAEIDTVIPQLNSWGVMVDGQGSYSDATGQFLVDPEKGTAYFEITVGHG